MCNRAPSSMSVTAITYLQPSQLGGLAVDGLGCLVDARDESLALADGLLRGAEEGASGSHVDVRAVFVAEHVEHALEHG